MEQKCKVNIKQLKVEVAILLLAGAQLPAEKTGELPGITLAAPPLLSPRRQW